MTARILLIEDDSALVELLQYNLVAAGYEVATAESAEQGRALLSQRSFDLLILDWMLPGMSGVDLCAILRASEQFAWLRILMLTARGQEVDRIQGMSAGADDYLVKPFSIPQLLARVSSLLAGHASGDH
jgi:two-component system phosphate regulon response regulator PhoB